MVAQLSSTSGIQIQIARPDLWIEERVIAQGGNQAAEESVGQATQGTLMVEPPSLHSQVEVSGMGRSGRQ